MKKTIFTREKLYELIWSTPINKIAKNFNVSEGGIKQTCIYLNIPRPIFSYWSYVRFDEKVPITNLSKQND